MVGPKGVKRSKTYSQELYSDGRALERQAKKQNNRSDKYRLLSDAASKFFSAGRMYDVKKDFKRAAVAYRKAVKLSEKRERAHYEMDKEEFGKIYAIMRKHLPYKIRQNFIPSLRGEPPDYPEKLVAKLGGWSSRSRAAKKKKGRLEERVAAGIAIGGFVLALVFISPNLTGKAIASVAVRNSNWLGVVLFLVGLVGSFFYLRNR